MHRRTIDMKKKSKLICAGVAGLMAVAIVGSMGLAFFSDTGETKASAKVGSVTIDVTDLEIENSGNVNPGDEDPDVPDGSREGTPHDFTFSVTNTGNKSVVTRNIITLSVSKNNTVLDANVLALYEDKKELSQKYVLIEGSEEYIPSANYTGGKIIAVRYVVNGASLNGTGDAAEVESGITSNSQDYKYALSLALETTNEYQLADIKADIEVQAMQYRNTQDSTWDTVFTDTKAAVITAS